MYVTDKLSLLESNKAMDIREVSLLLIFSLYNINALILW